MYCSCIEAIRRLTGQCYIWSMHIKAEYRQGSILKHLDRQCPPSFLSIISEGFKKLLNVGLEKCFWDKKTGE